MIMRTVRREEEKKNIFVDVDESYMKLVVLLPVLCVSCVVYVH